jgi:hypothetical protein
MIQLINRHLRRLSIPLLAALLAASAVAAQPAPAPDPPPITSGSPGEAIERMEAMRLGFHPGDVPVHYSHGFEERALHLAGLLADGMRFYEVELGTTAPVVLAVLDESDWPRVTPVPYGLPHPFVGDVNVVFLGATADHEAVHDIRRRHADAPLAFAAHLQQTGTSWDEAAALLLDLVGLHELGHIMTGAMGINTHRRWLSEMLASYIGYAYLRSERPELAAIWDGTLETVLQERPAHTSLADFERLYVAVGIPNYQWYQAALQQRAREVYDARGIAFVHALAAELPAGASGDLSTTALLARLERVQPGFHAWAERLGLLHE